VKTPSLLLTQCLQNDFAKPIGRFEAIPNRLHVGFSEAMRLMGEDPAHGPIARTMRWAYAQPDEALRLVHIRDWHDPDDPTMRDHLERFGEHCICHTEGAVFAFEVDADTAKDVAVIDSLTLNDFQGTTLAEVLAPYAGRPLRIGIVGVWTEAKVSFLAYELCTRYPDFQVAVCSALTASSTRQNHFEALDQLERILGVRVFDSVGDFADYGDRGAIKYRYASMSGAFATTFQKQYASGMPPDEVRRVLDLVFGEQLMRLYKAARRESGDLLEHYGFASMWADGVRKNVETILGAPQPGHTVALLPGVEVPNLADFYADTLAHLPPRPPDQFFQAYIHGDLNGANIILDRHDNVWLIDFFHTRRAHVLMDLIKLENDLLYIYTPVEDDETLRQAFAYTDHMMEVGDLGAPLPPVPAGMEEPFARTWETMRVLRSFYPKLIQSDREPLQLWIAQLRYAAHTLVFDESNNRHKRWALYTAAQCVARIVKRLNASGVLWVDWVASRWSGDGRIGMTLLPGRRDYRRNLGRDLASLRDEGANRILCLVPFEELEQYGVGDLLSAYRDQGLDVHHLPTVDQKVCSVEDMTRALRWVDEGIEGGESVVVHCVGGLGRSGMAVASYLKMRGATAEEALAEVRRARSPRAVETLGQEEFVRTFPADALGG